jgi:hypothetical protein
MVANHPDERDRTYFSAVEVQNIRCFGNQKQKLKLSNELGEPCLFTVLLGDNSTGKTTLLQSIAGVELIGVRTLSQSNGEKRSRGTCRLQVYESVFADPIAPILRGSIRGHIKISFLQTSERKATKTTATSDVVIDSDLVIYSHDLPALPPVCFGYGAGRGLGPVASGIETDDAAASLFMDGVKLLDAEEWLTKLDYSASKESPIQTRLKNRLNRVSDILINLLPDINEIRFTQPTDLSPDPHVEFKTPYGWVPLKALGHGYRSMISWMVDFASRMVDRYPDSANPLAEPAVVLVDEIDLHLHPKWQRQIIPHLMKLFPRTQFIVTAHSPLIVQAALDPSIRANVAVLRREGDHVVIDNNPESIRAWTVDQILTSPIYNLPTARPASLDEKLRRRKEMLAKPSLDDSDREELQTLEAEIGMLPTGESANDAERLLKLTEETSELLKRYKGTGS